MPASRSCTPSSTSATPSHVGAGLERGPGDRHRAVAVRVGLHDREQLRRARRRATTRRRWRGSRRDRPRSRPVGMPGFRSFTLTTDSKACSVGADRRRDRRRRGRARARATRSSAVCPCTHAPAAAASNGVHPPGEEPGDDPGEHVAAAGGGQPRRRRSGSTATRPSGAGDHGAGTLQQHDRAGAIRERAGGGEPVVADRPRPGAAAYSPAWGVSTAGAPSVRRASSAAKSPASALRPSASSTSGDRASATSVRTTYRGRRRRRRRGRGRRRGRRTGRGGEHASPPRRVRARRAASREAPR